MKTIPIHCMACNSHIFNTDTVRLHFPFAGEMFDPAVKGIVLRPGYLRLEIFCPVCGAFPFYHDGSRRGFKGVGRLLKSLDQNGKVKMMDVDDILVYARSRETTNPHWQAGGETFQVDPDHYGLTKDSNPDRVEEILFSKWPCQECGAKRTIHKKGCSLRVKQVESVAESREDSSGVPDWLVKTVEVDTGLAPDAPPTKEEIAELAREREIKAMRDKTADTRPIQAIE